METKPKKWEVLLDEKENENWYYVDYCYFFIIVNWSEHHDNCKQNGVE